MTATRLHDDGSQVHATFSDGTDGSFGVVIGADGIYSQTRKTIFPDAPEPQFTGQSVWRYNLPRPEGFDALHVYNGPTGVGLVPMSNELISLYATTPEPGNPAFPRSGLAGRMRERLAACASGCVVRASEIAGVLCRIGAVMPNDLPHIHEDDRVYVAAEMNAFLHAWLMQYPGVRFNDPSWISLAGPSWHPLRWTWTLERLGIPVDLSCRTTGDPTPMAVATIVGAHILGVHEPELVDYTRRVAWAVGSELLSVTFVCDDGWKFVSADPCPRIDAVVAGAVIERVFGRDGVSLDSRCGAA